VSSFDIKSRPVPVFVCREGRAEPMTLPVHILPGDETTLVFRDDRERRDVRMVVRSLVDRAEMELRFENGPPLSAGFVIIPFSVYDYRHLPRVCRDAAMK
jgi:hypothetical protein